MPRQRPIERYVPKPRRHTLSSSQRYALEEQFKAADKKTYIEGEKIIMNKWSGVKEMVKSQLQRHFDTEEELEKFLKENPQYTINQRFGFHTEKINVALQERGYAFTKQNEIGYRVPTRWLTAEEVEEYLKENAK